MSTTDMGNEASDKPGIDHGDPLLRAIVRAAVKEDRDDTAAETTAMSRPLVQVRRDPYVAPQTDRQMVERRLERLITLSVDGRVITGEIVAPQRWREAVAPAERRLGRQDGHELTPPQSGPVRRALLDDVAQDLTEYVHLKDVRGLGDETISHWRVRISDVSGWAPAEATEKLKAQ